MRTGNELVPQGREKVLLFGKPKGGGKSTLAMTAPGKKLVLQYDLGDITMPPGVDSTMVWVQDYPNINPTISGDTDRWTRPLATGKIILEDLDCIKKAFLTRSEEVTLSDGGTCPLPDTLILDGLVALTDHAVNWIMGVNRVTDADDMPGGGFSLWGKRLMVLNTVFNVVLSLPCRVILITWEQQEKKSAKDGKGRAQQEPTGRMIPDIGGGKMDETGAGKVDAVLCCYSQKTPQGVSFLVRTKPNENYPSLGIRNRYDGEEVIDVTLKKDLPAPWARIWKE